MRSAISPLDVSTDPRVNARPGVAAVIMGATNLSHLADNCRIGTVDCNIRARMEATGVDFCPAGGSVPQLLVVAGPGTWLVARASTSAGRLTTAGNSRRRIDATITNWYLVEMKRLILIREPQSGLQARFELLDSAAPRSAEMLWALSGVDRAHDAIHAMWTGPEISCPIAVAGLPVSLDVGAVPTENATSFPAAGELVLVPLPAGRWKGTGAADIVDLGFFYDGGGRLLMPMGWLTGNVCARVVPEDLSGLQAACRKIRARGACQLSLARCTP